MKASRHLLYGETSRMHCPGAILAHFCTFFSSCVQYLFPVSFHFITQLHFSTYLFYFLYLYAWITWVVTDIWWKFQEKLLRKTVTCSILISPAVYITGLGQNRDGLGNTALICVYVFFFKYSPWPQHCSSSPSSSSQSFRPCSSETQLFISVYRPSYYSSSLNSIKMFLWGASLITNLFSVLSFQSHTKSRKTDFRDTLTK